MSIPPPSANPYTQASLLNRFIGALIDGIIIGVVALVVFVASDSAVLTQVVAAALAFVYGWLLIARDGQTIGKKVANTRVVMVGTAAQPDNNAALIRAAVAQLPGVIPIVGPIYGLIYLGMIVFSKDHRGPHDLAAKTIVVEA